MKRDFMVVAQRRSRKVAYNKYRVSYQIIRYLKSLGVDKVAIRIVRSIVVGVRLNILTSLVKTKSRHHLSVFLDWIGVRAYSCRLAAMEGAGQQQADAGGETHQKRLDGDPRCGLILHQSELKSDEWKLLHDLEERLDGVVLFDMKDIGVQERKDAKKLAELKQHLADYNRVILAFPRSFQHAQLVLAIEEMVKCQHAFVTVIMYREEYYDEHFPQEIQEYNILRIMVDPIMMTRDKIAEKLKHFIEDNAKKLDLPFLNFGNGLAWSYYFGYLVKMIPDLENIIMESPWRKGVGKNVPEENILKRMLIYPKVEIMQKDLKLGRLIFHKNEVRVNRAGIDRRYEIDIREVKSKDGKETYYGVADYANCLQMLINLRDEDRNVSFFDMSEEMMVKQGQYFHARLGLFLYSGCMHEYNKKKKIDPSKFELQPFEQPLKYSDPPSTSRTPRNAPEEELVENLFERMKEACHAPIPVGLPEFPPQDVGIVCLSRTEETIKRFVGELRHGCSTRDLRPVPQLDSTHCKLKKVFMVLTDELVTSDYFEDFFYALQRRGSDKAVNNRRFLVCLDCLNDSATANHPALQLLVLFKCIKSSDPEWESKVKMELEGDPQQITYDLMFHNIGAGFAMSYYYRYLKFRIPPMKNIVEGTRELREKFINGSMSYKLFVLHPHTCQVQEKVSDADPDFIKDRDDDDELKNITFKDITHDRRIYSPKMSSIVDPNTGEKYFVFVEYNTQAETLHRMMKEGFLDNSTLLEEWDRFCNLLNRILSQGGPIISGKRLQIIRYDDKNETSGYLAQTILDRVKPEIKNEREEAKEMSK